MPRSAIVDDARPSPDTIPLVLTMGDPAGIGPDIAIEAWLSRRDEALAPFVVIGDADLFAARAAALGSSLAIARVESVADGLSVFPDALGIIHIGLPCDIAPGEPNGGAAATVIAAIERAVELVQKGEARALVTNPVNKKLLYDAGLPYPGHTEFLGALAQASGETASPIMMLVADQLRVVPATVHIPLKDVAPMVSEELIISTIRGVARDLTRYFGIDAPRIAVAGLNPHAGEMGAMGHEEIDIIGPAIDHMAAEGFHVSGPHSPDTLFTAHARDTYDAAIAMYHDQALIPIKTLAFDRAVNLTLGLPFVRTSPDHGTAYDLAGSGRASALSLIEALRLADQISARQLARST